MAVLVGKQQIPDSEIAMEIDAGRDGVNYYVTTPQNVCPTLMHFRIPVWGGIEGMYV